MRQGALILFTGFVLLIIGLSPAAVLGEERDIGTERIWVKPGGSHSDSIVLSISSDIFDKLPSNYGGVGGFSLTFETADKPPFIHHRISDSSASKVSSGFFSNCKLYISTQVSADNGTEEGEYAYNVVYRLQGSLLIIRCRYTVEVRQAKPQWVVEEENTMELVGEASAIALTSGVFILTPLFVLIRKIRRPAYSRGKPGWGRKIIGGAVGLFGLILIATVISAILTAQGTVVLWDFLPGSTFGVGMILICIIILMP